MTAQIIKFDPRDARTPDVVLEQAIGQYQSVVVIGHDYDGTLDARADLNLSRQDILWLLERVKMGILLGDGNDE